MAENVVALPKKKPKPRLLVTVVWGGFGKRVRTNHVCKKDGDCFISESELLIVKHEDGAITSYPIGSVYYWTERDEPDVMQ